MLSKGDFNNVLTKFDPNIKSTITTAKLQNMWKTVTDQYGPLKSQIRIGVSSDQGYQIIVISCQFEKAILDAEIVYNSSNQVSGLWFGPSKTTYQPPSYVKSNAFTEVSITVGTGEWSLPGTLTMPKGAGPFPVVVLVHGSGPLDRDETIGVNKPFRDLAGGLASRGIAVLRYEKRTKQYSSKIAPIIKQMTVKEETIDDAVAAVARIRKTVGIDSQKVFVLGHNLGGMLLPRIATIDPKIAGLIIMAGATRPLEDVILEQTTYVCSLKEKPSSDEQKELELIKQKVAKVKDANLLAAANEDDLPFGIPAGYWLDLKKYNATETAKGLKQRMLILHPDRDYQVTSADFQGWRDALSSHSNVEFKRYPTLNHLFIEGTGKSTPAEFIKPGHVAEFVINDIAAWVKK
jgi:dienelactone hydrolase